MYICVSIPGLLRSLKVFEFFSQIFKAWKVLENKTWSLKVLESVSEGPWKCRCVSWALMPQKCLQRSPRSPSLIWWRPLRLLMLIKVPVCLNLVLLIYPSYGPWKSLKSPWIWFWQMGKNPGILCRLWNCLRKVEDWSAWKPLNTPIMSRYVSRPTTFWIHTSTRMKKTERSVLSAVVFIRSTNRAGPMSIRTSVHKKFFRFEWNLVCEEVNDWCTIVCHIQG